MFSTIEGNHPCCELEEQHRWSGGIAFSIGDARRTLRRNPYFWGQAALSDFSTQERALRRFVMDRKNDNMQSTGVVLVIST